jgi:hypothetical protein
MISLLLLAGIGLLALICFPALAQQITGTPGSLLARTAVMPSYFGRR